MHGGFSFCVEVPWHGWMDGWIIPLMYGSRDKLHMLHAIVFLQAKRTAVDTCLFACCKNTIANVCVEVTTGLQVSKRHPKGLLQYSSVFVLFPYFCIFVNVTITSQLSS